MKKYLIIFISMLSISLLVGCNSDDEVNPPNYVSFQDRADVSVELDGSTTYDVNVYTANVAGSDRTFEVEVKEASLAGEAFDVPATVTIPSGSNEGVLSINVSDMGINPNGDVIVLGFVPSNDYFIGEDLTVNVTQFCDPELSIDFVFDGYASETTWAIRDAEGNIALQGGGFADGTGSASVKRCLTPGEYTFTVYDAYGDGLTYPETGSVTITYGGEELATIPGDFGEEATVSLTID